MSSRFQSAAFGSSPVFSNAVVWSEENLVAVACNNTVEILNPGNAGVRGVVNILPSKPFPVGVIDGGGKVLVDECLLWHNLSRDSRPSVRSISWSPLGLANNAGCLLAVCNTGGRVKLYRAPLLEHSIEFIEVMDISDMLYRYFKNTNFGDCEIISSDNSDLRQRQDSAILAGNEHPISVLKENRRRSSRRRANVTAEDPENMKESNSQQIVPLSFYEGKPREKESYVPLITVHQYASHSTMLMSLTVAWSPILKTSGNDVAIPQASSSCCSILAVGGKCGRISLWRIHAPEYYSISNVTNSNKVSLVGLLKAHDAWITAIDWESYGSDISNLQFILATGCCDGRVKIWKLHGEDLLKSSELIHDSVSLLKEVTMVESAPVSVLSLIFPSNTPCKLLLAIGKGSGAIEVCALDVSTGKFENLGQWNGHDCIVTGLAWAFDGRCLYSCSQDNSTKCWILVGNSLREVPIPSNNLGLRSSLDVPCVSDSCFGLALSPGNLVIVVARKFNFELLNPMYEARTQKAAAEFIWIGGQQLNLSSISWPDLDYKSFPGFSKNELTWWGSNILCSLKQYERLDRLLNLWDVVAALLAFKQSAPKFLEHILAKWLTSYFGSDFNLSTTFSKALESLPSLSSRKLHLINIITRCVVLKEGRADNRSSKRQRLEQFSGTKEDVNLWRKLLQNSENELLERVVVVSFASVLRLLSDKPVADFSKGTPDGLLQMEQWVSQKGENLKDLSNFLAAEVAKVEKRKFGRKVQEQCSFCSGKVVFESAEYAICSGELSADGVGARHRLQRCSTSMQILPCKPPSWYCVCCQRWASKLAPTALFTMPRYPLDFKSFVESSDHNNSSTPCCTFCGTLVQRLRVLVTEQEV